LAEQQIGPPTFATDGPIHLEARRDTNNGGASTSIMSDAGPSGQAEFALARGWRLFPLDAETGTPLIGKWPKRADTYQETLNAWAKKWPDAITAIATGAESNLVVIDVDVPLGEVTLAELQATHGTLPKTLEANSPTGGRHLYFTHPGGYVKDSESELGPNVDGSSS
jgi:hypothetical protein